MIRLTARNDRDLLVHLTAVRNALGGRYGIWEIIQDSLGEYLRRADGSVKNYREFCEMIVHPEDHRWLLRLIDFYRDVHLKETDLRRLRDEALFPLIRQLEAHLLETKEIAQAPAGATST